MYEEAHRVFDEAATLHGESAEAAAALGYTLHRLGDEAGSRRHLRRALLLDALHHEARVYLAHLLYDRGDWAGALREFERIRPVEQWDPVAVGRTIELKRALEGLQPGDALLREWEDRLSVLEAGGDPVDELLAEMESLHGVPEEHADAPRHRVVLSDGRAVEGTWLEIVIQIRDLYGGGAAESVIQFMRRCAQEERDRRGVTLPADDAASFVRGGERAGLWRIEA
jgi:tetratricopeptide (TPR) repeat protein